MRQKKRWHWYRVADAEVAEVCEEATNEGWELFSVTYVGTHKLKLMMHLLFFKVFDIPESPSTSNEISNKTPI